jgi:putative flippase GtrA
MSELRRTFRQFIVFCGVGGLNTVASLGIILFCIRALHINYLVANAIGYVCGLGLGFVMHRRITFRAQEGSAAKQIGPFLIVFGVGYAVQFGLLALLVQDFGMGKSWAQLPAWAVYVMVSYVGNRFLTFEAGRHKNG